MTSCCHLSIILYLSLLFFNLSFTYFILNFRLSFILLCVRTYYSPSRCSSVLLTLLFLFDIFCLIIYPFILSSNNTVNLYVHYFYMSPDIYYLTYMLLLICPSPHRRMISPFCSIFKYYPTTNIIYLAVSICM